MNTHFTRYFARAVAGAALLAFLLSVRARGADAVNLAVVATLTSSSVSGDTRNEALNDGSNPLPNRCCWSVLLEDFPSKH